MERDPWRAEWAVIAARIEGYLSSTEAFYKSIEKRTADDYGMLRKILFPEASTIYSLIQNFLSQHGEAMSSTAANSIRQFISPFADSFKRDIKAGTIDTNLPILQLQLCVLSSAKSQLNYHMSGTHQQLRLLTDRAFMHLQRCIIADDELREKWKKAFGRGETKCEALGAVHLLWHGIWAFKANAAGGRTDLVLGNVIDNQSIATEAALGLVLTEWKRAVKSSDAKAMFDQGREQVALYRADVLAGIELENMAYIVVVSEKDLPSLEDVDIGSRRYRFINIAVNPDTPSVAAAKA